MADDPNEVWVAMRHPDIDAENHDEPVPAAVVTLAAFEEAHKPKGWVMVPDSESADPDRIDRNVTVPRSAVRAAAKAAEKES